MRRVTRPAQSTMGWLTIAVRIDSRDVSTSASGSERVMKQHAKRLWKRLDPNTKRPSSRSDWALWSRAFPSTATQAAHTVAAVGETWIPYTLREVAP